jgi:hypothetical protein
MPLFNANHVFWISYLFTLIAFAIQLLINYYLINKNESSKTFNNLPLLIVGTFYFFIQIIVSIMLMIINMENLEFSIVIQSVILGIFIIIVLLLSQSKEHIEAVEEDTKNQTLFLTKMKKEVEILSNKVDDNLKDMFDELFEIVRYANPMSNEIVFSIEKEILSTLNELKREINQNNEEKILKLLDKLKEMFVERNALLK